jgi:hypothetical protein
MIRHARGERLQPRQVEEHIPVWVAEGPIEPDESGHCLLVAPGELSSKELKLFEPQALMASRKIDMSRLLKLALLLLRAS